MRIRFFAKAVEAERQAARLSALGNRAPGAESLPRFTDSGRRLLKGSSRGAFPASRRGGKADTDEIAPGLPM